MADQDELTTVQIDKTTLRGLRYLGKSDLRTIRFELRWLVEDELHRRGIAITDTEEEQPEARG